MSPALFTSSSTTSAVCEARIPISLYFWPMDSPAVPGGTMKLACPRAPSSGSTAATTMWRSAMPAVGDPGLRPVDSPAVGGLVVESSRLQVAHIGPGVRLRDAKGRHGYTIGLAEAPRAHSATCSGVPAATMQATPRVEPRMDSAMPASPQASSSFTSESSRPVGSAEAVGDEVIGVEPDPRRFLDDRPRSLLALVPLAAAGRTTLSANSWTHWRTWTWSSFSSIEKSPIVHLVLAGVSFRLLSIVEGNGPGRPRRRELSDSSVTSSRQGGLDPRPKLTIGTDGGSQLTDDSDEGASHEDRGARSNRFGRERTEDGSPAGQTPGWRLQSPPGRVHRSARTQRARTLAACSPFWPSWMSNPTSWPSVRVRYPGIWMAEWWTNTSPPSVCEMKP